MFTIDYPRENLIEIDKSKFIGLAFPILNENDAKEILRELKDKYNDATHICYAYVLESPKVEKASDDGEPGGTAGKPILEVIKKRKLSQVLVAVVRYFGGIKLGAGGLVRAYTNSATQVLSNVKILEVKEISKYVARVDCGQSGKLINAINSLGGEITNTIYDTIVSIEFVGEIEKELRLNFYNIEIQCVGKVDKICN